MNVNRRWIQSTDIAQDAATGELLVRIGSASTVKRQLVDAASAGIMGNSLIAPVAGKRLCVLGLCLVASETVLTQFFSGLASTGTPISGPIQLGTSGGIVLPLAANDNQAWLHTQTGEPLTLLLDAPRQVGGWVVYSEVD